MFPWTLAVCVIVLEGVLGSDARLPEEKKLAKAIPVSGGGGFSAPSTERQDFSEGEHSHGEEHRPTRFHREPRAEAGASPPPPEERPNRFHRLPIEEKGVGVQEPAAPPAGSSSEGEQDEVSLEMRGQGAMRMVKKAQGSQPHDDRANRFHRLPHEAQATAEEGSTLPEESLSWQRRVFLEEVQKALGSDARETAAHRAKAFEADLAADIATLRRNKQGAINPEALRSVLHQFFVKLHGWHVAGLAPGQEEKSPFHGLGGPRLSEPLGGLLAAALRRPPAGSGAAKTSRWHRAAPASASSSPQPAAGLGDGIVGDVALAAAAVEVAVLRDDSLKITKKAAPRASSSSSSLRFWLRLALFLAVVSASIASMWGSIQQLWASLHMMTNGHFSKKLLGKKIKD